MVPPERSIVAGTVTTARLKVLTFSRCRIEGVYGRNGEVGLVACRDEAQGER